MSVEKCVISLEKIGSSLRIGNILKPDISVNNEIRFYFLPFLTLSLSHLKRVSNNEILIVYVSALPCHMNEIYTKIVRTRIQESL
jgi:hypothetical protein